MSEHSRAESASAAGRRRCRPAHVYRLLLPLVLLVGGCGGDGGGNGPFSVDPGGEGSTTSTSAGSPTIGPTDEGDAAMPGDDSAGGTGVNGELSGKVLFTLVRPGASLTSAEYPHNTVLELEVQTGRYTEVVGNSSLDANGLLRREVTLSLAHDRSSSPRLIGTAKECSRSTDETTCVLLMDGNATIESVFIIPNGSSGVAKRSRDGRFIATMTPEAGLELYDTEGRRVSVNSEVRYFGSGTGSPYDWTADGRIVFEYTDDPLPSGPVVLARTLPYSTEIDTFITLPARYEGDVVSIDVSPSGDRAVLGIEGSDMRNDTYEYRRPAVLDLQSLSVYEPLAVEVGDSMDARDLSWSPDGRWLLFRRLWLSGAFDSIGALPISPIYAVRADGGRYELPTEPSGSTDKIRMLVMRPMDGSDGPLDPAHQTFSPSLWRE